MKKIPESQFNRLTSKRLTTVGSTLSDVIKTAQNNPEHLTEEKLAQIKDYLESAVENTVNALDAVLNQPTVEDIGEFKLGGGSSGASNGTKRKSVTRGKKAQQLANKLIGQKKRGEPIDLEEYDILPKSLKEDVDAVIAGEAEAAPAGGDDDGDQGAEVTPEPEAKSDGADETSEEAGDDELEDLLGDEAEAEAEPAVEKSSDDDLDDAELEALLSGD